MSAYTIGLHRDRSMGHMPFLRETETGLLCYPLQMKTADTASFIARHGLDITAEDAEDACRSIAVPFELRYQETQP